MLECYSSNATVAKIRCIEGGLLSQNSLHELAYKKSVGEVAEFLKEVPRFRCDLETVDPFTIHRGHLEELIEKSSFELYVRLCKFQQFDKIPFYNYTLFRHETEQILSMINCINSGVPKAFINTLPSFVLENSKLPFLEISKCESYEELLETLKKTDYGRVLKGIPLREDGLINYPVCELELRRHYYNKVFLSIKEDFSQKDGELLSGYIKTNIDFINIVNAYRLKKYFNYNAEHIKRRMLPFNHMPKSRLERIYESETAKDMLDLLDKIPLLHGNLSDVIENACDKARYSLAKRLLSSSQSAPVVMCAFMTIISLETSNIIKIIEGIRYSLPPTEIEKLIII